MIIDSIERITEVDLDGVTDEKRQIQYIGRARKNNDGTWQCLAAVEGALCLVEVSVIFLPFKKDVRNDD